MLYCIVYSLCHECTHCTVGIPVVITNMLEILEQYTWHLTKEDAENAFVLIPIEGTEKDPTIGDFIEFLAGFSDEELLRRRQHMARIAFKLQYSFPPDATARDIPSTNDTVVPWSPPQPDAVDIILKNMFSKNITDYDHKPVSFVRKYAQS